MVVRAQRGGVLPNHPNFGDHVLFHAEGGEPAGVLVPALDRAFLVVGVHLHLGGTAPSAQHRVAGVAAKPRHALLTDAVGTVLGRHAQRPAHPARRLGQIAQRPGYQILRRRCHLLRYGHLRRAADGHPLGQCLVPLHRLDDRSRPFRHSRLERVHGCGHVLLAGPAPLENPAVVQGHGRHALLDRFGGCVALHRGDVVLGHFPRPDAQPIQARRCHAGLHVPPNARKHPALLYLPGHRRDPVPQWLRDAGFQHLENRALRQSIQ